MNWILIIEIIYVLLIIGVMVRIIYDTQSVTKTTAYLLLIIFLPVAGAFIYFSFGINYRKNKLYSKKILQDKKQEEIVLQRLDTFNMNNLESFASDEQFSGLMKMIYETDRSPITLNNTVKLLINGEEKFPEVLAALRQARHHIHLEYYIYEDDSTGRAIEEVLIAKAKEGVEVRMIYDDFGSASIRKTLAQRLRDSGVNAVPFYKIKLIKLANHLNYRNHRKIIIIDGHISFVGGINISDKYSNIASTQNLFWRDTHLKIEGDATAILQHIFIGDWNYCAKKTLAVTSHYFPKPLKTELNTAVQIVSSGPDSDRPSIYYAMIKAIQSAKKEILITTPYFIPGETIIDVLKMAALSGIGVKLLVPGISDSFFVNSAAKSYYTAIMKAGVQVYFYKKGFVHAKTLVVDRALAMVGTANMDYRSFDLNFEVNALVYDIKIASNLADQFQIDLQDAELVHFSKWMARSKSQQLVEKTIRLVSPML